MRDARDELVRRSIAVDGVVQGVGFRPFVHALASRHALGGFVRNHAGGVHIEVEGRAKSIDRFLDELHGRPPPLARIDHVQCAPAQTLGESTFRIDPSDEQTPSAAVLVAPDAATCDACLGELLDPSDRRYRYPFINCAHCGPRLTIVTGAPYDRVRTTMADFAMCDACRAEYEEPSDRRFHAQPIACPACGPRLGVVDAAGRELAEGDALVFAVAALRAGRLLAIKGLGGYHLACSARDERAVRELRRRKVRDEKPFAIMVAGLRAAAELCEVSAEERALLESSARPIVLLRRCAKAPVAEAVAPGEDRLGVMLPYTPLHHLLLADMGEVPLVMTSGNRSDEPIVYDDAEALARLGSIADGFLVHDRPIQSRCDDSVAQVVPGPKAVTTLIRRARGFAPVPSALSFDLGAPTLAVGGHLKSTFALGAGRRAYVSHHLGDLDDYEALRAYRAAIDHYQRLFRVQPRCIAHDAHPDYASTREAQALAAEAGGSVVAVQHHHAHMASCMADNALRGPVIGVCFDGAGLGADGAIWGGEFLVGDYAGFRRAGHLGYVGMPGGERAVREPWRMALALLRAASIDPAHTPLAERVSADALATVARMLDRDALCPRTSSVGRLFDGVASIVGACDRIGFDGQAAMALERLARSAPADGAYAMTIDEEGDGLVLDPRGLVRATVEDLRRGARPQAIARRFHDALAEAIVDVCARIRRREGLDDVVLSGGVFVNSLLSAEAALRLDRAGFRVHRHRHVPPNDGGLCLGQLAVAAALQAGGRA